MAIIKTVEKKSVLNKHEFFKAKNVLREEMQKGNNPKVLVISGKDAFHVYIEREGLHINGGNINDYIGYAKKENLANKKAQAIEDIKEWIIA